MDLRILSDLVSKQLIDGKFREAEAELLAAHHKASETNDAAALEHILALLVQLCCSTKPPDLAKAEAFSREREQVNGSAYNKLQTAMVFYHVAGDYPRTVAKLQEAVSKGRAENDDPTVYTSLSLLGQALLKSNQISEATAVLKEIERMLLGKKRFVVGDETPFLECACNRGVAVASVKRLAAALVPLCRDAEFSGRLKALVDK